MEAKVSKGLGTPGFAEMAAEAGIVEQTATRRGYIDGVQAALIVSGLVAIGGATLAWLLTGRRDPIGTVFEMRGERPDL